MNAENILNYIIGSVPLFGLLIIYFTRTESRLTKIETLIGILMKQTHMACDCNTEKTDADNSR